MLIKKWSFLIRCLQGHRPGKEGVSHFGNTVSVVMKLVHRQSGEDPTLSLVLKTSPSKLISNKKRRPECQAGRQALCGGLAGRLHGLQRISSIAQGRWNVVSGGTFQEA